MLDNLGIEICWLAWIDDEKKYELTQTKRGNSGKGYPNTNKREE